MILRLLNIYRKIDRDQTGMIGNANFVGLEKGVYSLRWQRPCRRSKREKGIGSVEDSVSAWQRPCYLRIILALIVVAHLSLFPVYTLRHPVYISARLRSLLIVSHSRLSLMSRIATIGETFVARLWRFSKCSHIRMSEKKNRDKCSEEHANGFILRQAWNSGSGLTRL